MQNGGRYQRGNLPTLSSNCSKDLSLGISERRTGLTIDWTKCFHIDYAPLIVTEDRVAEILGNKWGDVDRVREIINYGAEEEIVVPICEKYFLSVITRHSVNSLPPIGLLNLGIFETLQYQEPISIYNFDAEDVLKHNMPECISDEETVFKAKNIEDVNKFYKTICESLGVPGIAIVTAPKYGGNCKKCGTYDSYPEPDESGKIICWRCCCL